MSYNRIIVIKHGSIGDIFMSLDSVMAIQKKYSDITLLSTNSGHRIFDDSDFNFKKIIDNRRGFFNTCKILFRIINLKFDIVIDLQNSKRTSFYLLMLKFLSKSISNGTSFFASKRYHKINLDEHVKEGLKNQLSKLDIQVDGVVNDHQRNIKQQVIIVPGSSKEGLHKRWDISNFISLMNYLSNRDVAIVSEIAGTTRDVIETHLSIDGYPVIISDTAGIRESKDEIEKKGIKLSLNKAEEADLKLVVVDAKSPDFTDVLKGLLDENAILVINKSDLLEKEIDSEIKNINHVLISIKYNKNIDELISKIKNNLKNKFITSDDILITRERHRQHLQQCLNNLNNFNQKKEIEDFDKAAEDLRLATRHLGMIVGKVDVEEILGSIFNDFCIGK